MYWTSSSGCIELNITKREAAGASHMGQCDADVRELSLRPNIARQLNKIEPDLLASVLREYGAWETEELADHAQNLQRVLWLACGDIVEEGFAA